MRHRSRRLAAWPCATPHLLKDTHGIAETARRLADVALHQRDYDTAVAYFAESLALRRDWGDIENIASALSDLGTAIALQADVKSAKSHFAEALALYQQLEHNALNSTRKASQPHGPRAEPCRWSRPSP